MDIDTLIAQVVTLQQAANQVPQTDMIDLLKLETKAKGKAREAKEIFGLLSTLIEQIHPSSAELLKRCENPLRELSDPHSHLYTQVIEQVCDKLLENADKSIDDIEMSG